MGWRISAIAVAVTTIAWTCGGVAGASDPPFQFALQLSTRTPKTVTGLSFHTHYSDPANPNGQPPPLRKSVIHAPAGSVFNGHAVPVCSASDNSLMASGASVCPQGSQVGTGSVIVITGCGAPVDPATLDVALFNSGDGITELFTDHKTGARITVGHAKFTAPNELTETPSPNPGCPPVGETSVRQVDFHFSAMRGPGGAAFITSPGSCPASRLWTSNASATLANGATYTATSATPCNRRPAHRHHRHKHRHHRPSGT